MQKNMVRLSFFQVTISPFSGISLYLENHSFPHIGCRQLLKLHIAISLFDIKMQYILSLYVLFHFCLHIIDYLITVKYTKQLNFPDM